ncbi:RTA1 [Colletotrichum tamarilloi]|uniref:RTA1 n=1 Tax=Colletotrichum tamarilloi TaxID=1209934 RepID=A0ABQ9RMI8_9PEZI|nr:RTA1 [Colletotrichum tamarilloi]KAK1507509.1 RTA1 [Colletotrichum tamarilloi]
MDGLNSTTGAGGAEAAAGEAFDFRLYRYTPSLPAAIVSAAVFSVLTILHVWRLYRARAFYFTAFALGGIFQTIGYCGRIWSHFDTTAIGGFVMQAILILVAPALYAASIYMILGRLIRTLRADNLSLLPVPWVTKIFVTGDVVSFTMQAGGGGIQAAGTLELYDIGEKIIIVGLLVQIVVFGFFIITTILFHHRISRKPTSVAIEGIVPWRRYLWVLYSTSLIILVRSVFRVIEYLQGNRGYLISHEIFLYIFDTVLMVAVMAIFLVWYVEDLEQKVSRKDRDTLGSSDSACMLEELSRRHTGRK